MLHQRLAGSRLLRGARACTLLVTTCAALVTLAAAPAHASAGKSKSSASSSGKQNPKKDAPEHLPRLVTTSPGLSDPLRNSLEEALNGAGLDGADVGFIATRLKDGVVLAESGADTLINPASNDKLITSSAVLDVLKPEYRFKTEYFVTGPIKDGVLKGSLVVKGYGDPTISSERLQHVANELALYGIDKITGSIIVDDTWFDAQTEPPGWEQEDAPDRAYAAPISAVMLNYNAVALYTRPTEVGQPAILKVDPPVEYVELHGDVDTAAGKGAFHLVAKAEKDTTVLTVQGTVGTKEGADRSYRRVYDPARYFGSGLVYFLQQRGVSVKHNIVVGTLPAGSHLIYVDKSPALTQVVSDLNHYSNNIIAETLIKQMGAEVMGAPGTTENGVLVAKRFLEDKVGFVPGSYVLKNGSGLNDTNRFSARQLAKLIAFDQRNFETGNELTTSLAIAGTQGTIGFRMRDTPAQRHLRAKTGTLHGVSALSGVVSDPSGDVVVFSILTQGLKNGISPAWKAQNDIGVALASGGTFHPGDDKSDSDAVSLNATPYVRERALGGAP